MSNSFISEWPKDYANNCVVYFETESEKKPHAHIQADYLD